MAESVPSAIAWDTEFQLNLEGNPISEAGKAALETAVEIAKDYGLTVRIFGGGPRDGGENPPLAGPRKEGKKGCFDGPSQLGSRLSQITCVSRETRSPSSVETPLSTLGHLFETREIQREP